MTNKNSDIKNIIQAHARRTERAEQAKRTEESQKQEVVVESTKQNIDLTELSNNIRVLSNNINSLNSKLSSNIIGLSNNINILNSGLSSNIKNLSDNIVSLNLSTQSERNTIVSEKLKIIDLLNEIKHYHTELINVKDINASNGYKVLNIVNKSGTLKELTIRLNVKPELYIEVDNIEVYNIHANFDDLSTTSDYSDTISAITSIDGLYYILNIKDIKFTKSLFVSFYFSGNATINNIFCVYDIEV